MINADGSNYTTHLYKAWGEKRYPSGASGLLTTFRFTGQREQVEIGLHFYGARWWDSSLSRFAQADTIIPLASQGVQAWDRYAGMNNNPVRYRDPSGHWVDEYDFKDPFFRNQRSIENGDNYFLGPKDAKGIFGVDTPMRVSMNSAVEKGLHFNPPTGKEILDAVVPNDGTVGVGISGTVGGVIYVTGSVGFHLDSQGNLALISPSVGGGALLPGAAEVALFGTGTDAENVEQLGGWSMVIGGSFEGGGSVGGEGVFFKDPNTKQKFRGGTVTAGVGGAAPVPAEFHIGVNYTWLPFVVNLYDVFGFSRP